MGHANLFPGVVSPWRREGTACREQVAPQVVSRGGPVGPGVPSRSAIVAGDEAHWPRRGRVVERQLPGERSQLGASENGAATARFALAVSIEARQTVRN
jgi:hypothetical protein